METKQIFIALGCRMRAALSAAKRRMCFHNPFLTAYLLVDGSVHCFLDYYLCAYLEQFFGMDCHTFILFTFLVKFSSSVVADLLDVN